MKTQWMQGHCWDRLTDRSYTVEVDGKLLHRNRQYLKPSVNAPVGEESAEQIAPSDEEAIPPTGPDSGRHPTLVGEVPRNQDSRPVRDNTEVSKNFTPVPSDTTLNVSARPREPIKELFGVPTQCEVTTCSGRTSKKPNRLLEGGGGGGGGGVNVLGVSAYARMRGH